MIWDGQGMLVERVREVGPEMYPKFAFAVTYTPQ
jgi:hypothetical protein